MFLHNWIDYRSLRTFLLYQATLTGRAINAPNDAEGMEKDVDPD